MNKMKIIYGVVCMSLMADFSALRVSFVGIETYFGRL